MVLASLISRIQTESDHVNRVALLEQAIPLAEAEGNRRLWANLQGLLGASLFASAAGAFEEVRITRMLNAYNAALSVYVPESTPEPWFDTQCNLASTHRLAAQVMVTNREKHVEAAIAAYFAALDHARDISAEAYRFTCQNLIELLFLASAWRGREALSQAEGICGYAITTIAPEQDPRAWAIFHLQLARAIAERGADSTEDQERSITAAEEALRVLRFETHSSLWALANLHLGGGYRTRTLGRRDENLERAVECLECALRVLREEDAPTEWLGPFPKCGHAAVAQPIGFIGSCSVGGSMGMFAFN